MWHPPSFLFGHRHHFLVPLAFILSLSSSLSSSSASHVAPPLFLRVTSELYVMAKRYNQAVEMCLDHKVRTVLTVCTYRKY